MKYKVGDKVVVKSWEQMAEEYEESKFAIDTPNYGFIIEMKPLCGTILTITEVNETNYRCEGQTWRFTDEMLLPYEAVETNADHYHDEIWKILTATGDFAVTHSNEIVECNVDCDSCKFSFFGNSCTKEKAEWFNAPYKQPVDWSKVAVDTKILVQFVENGVKHKRHFAEYKDGVVYCWYKGTTSFTTIEGKTKCYSAELVEDK